MDIKHREVMLWLKDLYAGNEVPSFEKTERSVALLHQIMTTSKIGQPDALVLIEDNKTKTLEYEAESTQVNSVLNTINISSSMLSPVGQKALSALTSIQLALNLQSSSTTNILLGFNQLEEEHSQLLSEKKFEQRRLSHLLDMSQVVSQKLEEIRRISEEGDASSKVQQEELERSSKRNNFNLEKIKNYKTDLNQYEARLQHIGLTKDITHSAIEKQTISVDKLEKEVKKLEETLAAYTLPPDMALAQVKVEQSRQELAKLMEGIAISYNPA